MNILLAYLMTAILVVETYSILQKRHIFHNYQFDHGKVKKDDPNTETTGEDLSHILLQNLLRNKLKSQLQSELEKRLSEEIEQEMNKRGIKYGYNTNGRAWGW